MVQCAKERPWPVEQAKVPCDAPWCQGTAPAKKCSDLLESYRSFYVRQGLFADVGTARSCRAERVRLELHPSAGCGWAEIVRLANGPMVGMCDYQFDRPVVSDFFDTQYRLGFHLLLTGNFNVSLPQLGLNRSVRSRELWFRSGTVDCAHYVQPSGCAIRGVSIELPTEMVEAWLGGGAEGFERNLELLVRHADSAGRSGQSFAPQCCSTVASPTLLQGVSRLLATSRKTLCDELQFESQVLDLLARLLATDAFSSTDQQRNGLSGRQRAAVDHAIDILRGECNDPPTISALARRVGVNECYLKSWFRARTGLSVGEYVRKLRMDNALELIESGEHSVLEVANYVGYTNPGHFSAAFRKCHGRLPSCYLSRE